jgi:hypothetical protein
MDERLHHQYLIVSQIYEDTWRRATGQQEEKVDRQAYSQALKEVSDIINNNIKTRGYIVEENLRTQNRVYMGVVRFPNFPEPSEKTAKLN